MRVVQITTVETLRRERTNLWIEFRHTLPPVFTRKFVARTGTRVDELVILVDFAIGNLWPIDTLRFGTSKTINMTVACTIGDLENVVILTVFVLILRG